MKLVVSIAFAVLGACQTPRTSTSPYLAPGEVARSTVEAEVLSKKAADLVATDLDRAEAMLRGALARDLFYGPAHNNLGVVFLKREKLYEAANEFEWAKKLMPGHPDPRVNLALVLEKAGRVDEAIATYKSALEVWPDYLPAMEGVAAATIRASRTDERTGSWLATIASEGDASWRSWALREQSQSR